jgi:hypothetical protein
MRKLILTAVAAVAVLALAAPAAAAPTRLVVAMHDPGCHWFSVGAPAHTRYVKTVTHAGPVALVNYDEATLIVKGPGGTHLDKVGANLTLSAKGVYRITMVHQAADDNHLKLTIR